MNGKKAKRLRREARELAQHVQGEGDQQQFTRWRPVEIKRGGEVLAKTERPQVLNNPLSLRGILRNLKRATPV